MLHDNGQAPLPFPQKHGLLRNGDHVPAPRIQPRTLRPHQLDLLRRTIAKDCTREEFDLFIEAADRVGLDPFRRQIQPLVFGKGRSDTRRMVILIGLDGQRIIAQRCGNYRPANQPTKFVQDARKKDRTNPAGLLWARVTLWQQDNRGNWFPVAGEAHWEEFAPIRDEWAQSAETGQWELTGSRILDRGLAGGSWARMPRLMLGKCATMQALRAGWPEEFGGLYAEEEMDRARVMDQAASEIVERQREERRLVSIAGKDAITVFWGDGALENVPIGQFADRVLAWIRDPKRASHEVSSWADANREPLRLFWAKAPADALALKQAIEAASRREEKR